jgi:cysteine sulfinate desulfinase/cysteine desulfurase-like protein
LRFSLGRHTTDADVDRALSIVPSGVEQLRQLSPEYKKSAALQPTA